MTQYTMTIDGQPASSPGTLKVINPATGEVFAEVPDCTREQLDVAMESAQRAFNGWKDDYEKRRAVMYACADALEANAEELGRLATMEQGMTLPAGIGSVMGAARNFRWYADLDIPRVTVQDDNAALIEIVRRPIGVIAAIKPWNVPIGMAVNTIAPAFRAGCTVVLKPSPYTPVVTARLGEVLRDIVPAGGHSIEGDGYFFEPGSAPRWACGASTPTPIRRLSTAPGPRPSGNAQAKPPRPGSGRNHNPVFLRDKPAPPEVTPTRLR